MVVPLEYIASIRHFLSVLRAASCPATTGKRTAARRADLGGDAVQGPLGLEHLRVARVVAGLLRGDEAVDVVPAVFNAFFTESEVFYRASASERRCL